ncbi:uncharacterized protein LOC100373239 isoform X2 [Saccoglossus kowalevskii]|uniref:PEST proteolytic signal-containing nuclear protein n=1 Tax=Saccoglossus kowalevskii TaxID=10224 RepID=A0ABM0GZZ7_SACKO|nr:PREDICTED: PEST proteolytic signal-containing nuclear protein-like [Saccoglossus kowalevskii]
MAEKVEPAVHRISREDAVTNRHNKEDFHSREKRNASPDHQQTKKSKKDFPTRTLVSSTKTSISMKLGAGSIKQNLQSDKTATSRGLTPITMKIGSHKPKEHNTKLIHKKGVVANVFGEDSDEDVEEMPPEAKMRMKNIGRETPTSAGPNSFGKSKQGFSDGRGVWDRKIKSLEKAEDTTTNV